MSVNIPNLNIKTLFYCDFFPSTFYQFQTISILITTIIFYLIIYECYTIVQESWKRKTGQEELTKIIAK